MNNVAVSRILSIGTTALKDIEIITWMVSISHKELMAERLASQLVCQGSDGLKILSQAQTLTKI